MNIHGTIGRKETIHGCAVAVGDVGLLVLGESDAGKSRLVAELVASWSNPEVRLVADDRVVLSRHCNRLVGRPHPAIAGQIEFRGIGILPANWLEAVVLRCAIRLVREKPQRLPEADASFVDFLGVRLPCVSLLADCHLTAKVRAIWPSLRGKTVLNGKTVLSGKTALSGNTATD
jgi:HPr kinase/phosphorylase